MRTIDSILYSFLGFDIFVSFSVFYDKIISCLTQKTFPRSLFLARKVNWNSNLNKSYSVFHKKRYGPSKKKMCICK